MLESGLQAALVGLVCCVCIWLQWPFQNCMLSTFFAIEFPIGIYRRSSLEGQGPPPMRTLGGLPPCPPPPPPPPPAPSPLQSIGYTLH